MKKAYLRGYYGYKNFGDELLFFGVVKRIFSHYPKLEQLVIEVGNKTWMEYWTKKNYQNHIEQEHYQKLFFVEIKQHRWRRLTHIINMLGFGKYRSYFKFFGGGEVLTDQRKFPHDGRNIPLLFGSTVRTGNFMLLGGVGTPKKTITKRLYALIIPRAKGCIVREETSYHTVLKRNKHVAIHTDFSRDIIQNNNCPNKEKSEYVLINCNENSRNEETKQRIVHFCQKHINKKKIFFPGDISQDIFCFEELQKDIPDLELYDWTKYSIEESLCLFNGSHDAIGARLHFLLPLKLYQRPFTAIKYAEKIYKMID